MNRHRMYSCLLSDDLRVTRDRLRDRGHAGLVLCSDDVEAFVKRFNSFLSQAREYEEEILILRWNLKAAEDRLRLAASPQVVTDAADMPGSNVVIGPFVRREAMPACPTPGDGRDGAA